MLFYDIGMDFSTGKSSFTRQGEVRAWSRGCAIFSRCSLYRENQAPLRRCRCGMCSENTECRLGFVRDH